MNTNKTILALMASATLQFAYADQTRSLAETKKLESQVTLNHLLAGGEVSAYWSSHIASHMRTAVLPR